MARVYAPTAFRFPASTGRDYPAGWQDLPDALADQLVAAGVCVDQEPERGPASLGLSDDDAVALKALASSSRAGLGTTGMPALTTWLPLQEGAGATVADALNPGITGTIGGTLGSQWGALPGVTFNGTDNQITFTAANNLHREIFNLATLNGRDQLLVWMVLSHPSTIATGALFWWGLNAGTCGFGFHVLNTNNFVQWRDRPPGSSTFTQTALQNQRRACSLLGNGGSANTRTAIAMTVEAHETLPVYEISVSKASVLVQGTIQQQDHMVQTVTMLPNSATSRTSWDATAGLTLGASPGANQTTFSGRLPAAHALVNFGAQRRTIARGGIAVTVARALARSPLTFPAPART